MSYFMTFSETASRERTAGALESLNCIEMRQFS